MIVGACSRSTSRFVGWALLPVRSSTPKLDGQECPSSEIDPEWEHPYRQLSLPLSALARCAPSATRPIPSFTVNSAHAPMVGRKAISIEVSQGNFPTHHFTDFPENADGDVLLEKRRCTTPISPQVHRIVKLLDSLRFDQYRHNRFASDCQALFSIETAKDCGCVSLGFSIGGASAM